MLAKTEVEELTKKREEFTSDIRKSNREDFFRKKRSKPEEFAINSSPDLKDFIDSCLQKTFTLNDFPYLLENINNPSLQNEYLGIIGLRKLLSIEENPPIQAVIDANLITKFIEFMGRTNQPSLQLESTWALTNIATGNSYQTKTIVDRGGLEALILMLNSKTPELIDQAIWALGNIAGDSIEFRDLIIKEGLSVLIDKTLNAYNYKIFKNGAWALSNLCRGKPRPNYEVLKFSIPVFAKVLRDYKSEENEDIDVLVDALWALSYLSTGNEHILSIICENGCIGELIKIFDKYSSNLSILIPCLRTLGNIITGSEEQTKLVVNQGGIDRFFSLLSHDKKTIRKEACWALSNITTESSPNIALIFNNPCYIKKLLTMVTIDCEELKKEAAWVLCNCSKFGAHTDIFKLVEWGGLEIFESLLDSKDAKTLIVAIEGISNILYCGNKFFGKEGPNQFLMRLEKTKAISKLEELQFHPNNEVYQKVIALLETFFDTAENL